MFTYSLARRAPPVHLVILHLDVSFLPIAELADQPSPGLANVAYIFRILQPPASVISMSERLLFQTTHNDVLKLPAAHSQAHLASFYNL
jgi:hypothetical protein